ncbi:MAG TPA: hypothetical protein VFU02_06900 [Polyangiaceae bacterium]|nr:hypothetical protein [Polyangiaceae bacterium]
MRTLIKLSSLAAMAGLILAVGCGSDDSDDDDSTSAGGSGGSNGDGGTTTTGGTTGDGGTTSTTGTGGSAGGGSGGAPPTDEAPYAHSDCLEQDGPNAEVTGSQSGAFAESADWHAGWTNFSTDSSGVDCSGTLADLPIESDGTFSDDDTTLTAEDGPYLLDQKVYVADGQTLTVEPGTVFCGAPDGSLIVSRGGMIDAEGTADEPIVFTSIADEGDKQKGDWGGVILLGNGESFKGEDVIMEGLADEPRNLYGGSDNSESSGTLAYVRIEFGGTEIGPGVEINGLTMGAVGSGTSIHHIEVNTTLDDCFEWFGGAVDADHLVCNNTGDDMFDADQGYSGTIDTVLGVGVDPLSEDPNGFEMDSDLGGASPTTTITASNATLCGSGEEEAGLTYGMVLRELLQGNFSNIVISGFNAGVDTRDDFGSASDPHVTIANSIMFENLTHAIAYDETNDTDTESPSYDDDGGFDERAWFEDGEGNMFFE